MSTVPAVTVRMPALRDEVLHVLRTHCISGSRFEPDERKTKQGMRWLICCTSHAGRSYTLTFYASRTEHGYGPAAFGDAYISQRHRFKPIFRLGKRGHFPTERMVEAVTSAFGGV